MSDEALQEQEALEQHGLEEEAEPRSPLIPDDLAKEIFDARREVVSRQIELEGAQETVKLRRSQLAQAQGHVFELIVQAESGQTRLFGDQELADEEKPGEAEGEDAQTYEPDSAQGEEED